jgi:hypothetical protein
VYIDKINSKRTSINNEKERKRRVYTTFLFVFMS